MISVPSIGEQLLPLCITFIGDIKAGKKEARWFIQEYFTGTGVMLQGYYALVGKGELTRIEELEKSEKDRIWGIVQGWIRERKVEEKKDAARVVHFIETLMEKKIEN
jgi:hypothetical protein